MNSNQNMQKILSQVVKKITPNKKELLEEQKIAEEIMQKIKKIKGNHIETMLCGSVSRNTHLKGSRDLDIFVLYPKEMSRKQFEKEGLEIGKKIFKGKTWKKEFAEHPYIRGNYNGFEVEIVPSYKVNEASLLQSAVDRSPFHKKYLEKKLKYRHLNEIRLLRQFLKGIDCYGAKIKVNSVPGYVVELLVLNYGSFLNVLKAVSEWKKETIIDIEEYWKNYEEKAKQKFDNHCLIVVDPTDKNRNVASALSYNQFARFIAASRKFLDKPSKAFFFKKTKKPWHKQKIKKILNQKEILLIEMPYPKGAHYDVVWGQLKRLELKLRKQLELTGFGVMRIAEWTDEKKLTALIVELKTLDLEKVFRHSGPEVIDEKNSAIFLKENKKIIAGPRIENGRWVVEKKRDFFLAQDFLKNWLKKEKSKEKLPIKKSMAKARVYRKSEALKLYSKNKDFQLFLTHYLKGKEDFLEY